MSRRISVDMADVQKCNREHDLGISVILNNELQGFDAFIKGPKDTPYEGGVFQLQVIIPSNYPIKPPFVTFKTLIWHPNVSSVTGYICLDILDSKWHGCMNFRSVLLSVQNLLANPEPNDPQDSTVGAQALRNPQLFRDTAQMWTHIHAGGVNYNHSLKETLDRLTEMGYSSAKALESLSGHDWNINEAAEDLPM